MELKLEREAVVLMSREYCDWYGRLVVAAMELDAPV